MDHHQLIDSLTSHISLYHAHSQSQSQSNPNPRTQILKWFSSLSLHHRQSHLTVVDRTFLQTLLRMISKLRSNGHGSFILLPDLPSQHPPFLPTLCFKRSRGLLARAAANSADSAVAAGRILFDSARLFEAAEGEGGATECSCSAARLDTFTVAETLLENVDEFVDIMDRVSNGGFLRGEESNLGNDWVELNWLKAMGYYGIEAFLANRIEVSMRLAWMNSGGGGGGGRKRGVKLKEKMNSAGIAGNVFWRKKGCVDWWEKMDAVTRKRVLTTILSKTAKPLVRFLGTFLELFNVHM